MTTDQPDVELTKLRAIFSQAESIKRKKNGMYLVRFEELEDYTGRRTLTLTTDILPYLLCGVDRLLIEAENRGRIEARWETATAIRKWMPENSDAELFVLRWIEAHRDELTNKQEGEQ